MNTAVRRTVADFNRCTPIGSLVRYWTGVREGEGRQSRTRTAAHLLGGHTPVVWVEGEASCSALWDWAIRKAGSDAEPAATYVNESAARSCCFDGMELIKRRAGTSRWVPGDAQ